MINKIVKRVLSELVFELEYMPLEEKATVCATLYQIEVAGLDQDSKKQFEDFYNRLLNKTEL